MLIFVYEIVGTRQTITVGPIFKVSNYIYSQIILILFMTSTIAWSPRVFFSKETFKVNEIYDCN